MTADVDMLLILTLLLIWNHKRLRINEITAPHLLLSCNEISVWEDKYLLGGLSRLRNQWTLSHLIVGMLVEFFFDLWTG